LQGRIGKNHPILATDGDMLKIALAKMHKRLQPYGARIVNIIHDEAVVEAPEEHIVTVARIVKKTMEDAAKIFIKTIPIYAETKIRDAWWKDGVGFHDDENGQQLELFPLGVGWNDFIKEGI
jgi:DNA polymerase-1